MLCVDDVRELPAVDVLLKHPHLDRGGEALQGPGVPPYDPRYGGAPVTMAIRGGGDSETHLYFTMTSLTLIYLIGRIYWLVCMCNLVS